MSAINRHAQVLRRWLRYKRALQMFRTEFKEFGRLSGCSPRFSMRWEERYPCLDDRDAPTAFDRQYFYHLAWAARVLAETRPARHVDVSSQNLFVATVSAFVPMESYEFHRLPVALDGLSAGPADLCCLPFGDGSILSLSCMHAVEHVGLGRYGDPLDPDGDLKAVKELQRVLAPGGQLLFVVPVGRPRVVFNAHRVYGYGDIVKAFPGLTLREFALIPDGRDQGELIRNADPALVAKQEYSCGCFLLCRPA